MESINDNINANTALLCSSSPKVMPNMPSAAMAGTLQASPQTKPHTPPNRKPLVFAAASVNRAPAASESGTDAISNMPKKLAPANAKATIEQSLSALGIWTERGSKYSANSPENTGMETAVATTSTTSANNSMPPSPAFAANTAALQQARTSFK